MARLSDTRFALVATAAHAQPIHGAAVALRQTFDSKALLDHVQVGVRASIGIAGFPGHARDADGVVRRAWTASMDAATSQERVSVYDEQRDAQQMRRLRLIEDLRLAIGTEQLSLAFQPQYDLRTARIQGAEALIRWRHPELGSISPGEFIPLAEQSGSIKQLTRWVFARACAQSRDWRRRGIGIKVAVNVSANDLADIAFPGFVLRTLDEYGVAPAHIELEITETALAGDLDRALETLRILSGLGLRIAIDDFGTGFSSLAQLKRFPIDVLKIDRSFVARTRRIGGRCVDRPFHDRACAWHGHDDGCGGRGNGRDCAVARAMGRRNVAGVPAVAAARASRVRRMADQGGSARTAERNARTRTHAATRPLTRDAATGAGLSFPSTLKTTVFGRKEWLS